MCYTFLLKFTGNKCIVKRWLFCQKSVKRVNLELLQIVSEMSLNNVFL